MKRTLIICLLLVLGSVIYSQDVIIKNDGTTIDCFITSVDSSKVYYDTKVDGTTVRASISKDDIRQMKFGVNTTPSQPIVTQPAINAEAPLNSVTSKKRFEGGIYFGCTFPTFAGSDAPSYGDSLSYFMYLSTELNFGFKNRYRLFPMNVGVSGALNITSWLSLCAGVEYIPKGIRYHGKASDEYDIDYKIDMIYKVNYIEVPLAIQLSTRSWRKPEATFIYIRGGIAPSFKVMAKYKYYIYATDGTDSDSDSDTDDLEGTMKKDFCEFITVGIGSGSDPIFEIKYEQGTKSVMDPGYSPYYFKNKSFSFNLIIPF